MFEELKFLAGDLVSSPADTATGRPIPKQR